MNMYSILLAYMSCHHEALLMWIVV